MAQVLDCLFLVAYSVIRAIQPFLVPVCFVIAWMTLLFGLWSVWSALWDGFRRAQQMHQIPCSDCQYFSGNYLLKCPLHPKEALSEDAIGCRDFETSRVEWPLPKV